MPIQFGSMTLYTVADLAEMLEVSESTIRGYLRDGIIRGKKMGRKWYIPDEGIQVYFREPEEEQAPGPEAELTEPEPESEQIEPESEVELLESEPEAEQPKPEPETELAEPEPEAKPPETEVELPGPAPETPQAEIPILGSTDAEVEQLLKEIERLKREAERVERLYAPKEDDTEDGPAT